jgi:hypothetical protein
MIKYLFCHITALPHLGEITGVADQLFHPVEPLSIRLSVAGRF